MIPFDISPVDASLPLCAPLPRPFVAHLQKRPSHRLPGFTLAQQVAFARHALYLVLWPYVRTGLSSYSVLTFLTMNTPGKLPVGTQTFSLWHERGLLRYRSRGRPDPQNAVALIIARMIDERERNWLPSEMDAAEPDWWCFRQDAPDAPIVPCPVPLPSDLPPSALLWTPWEGAAWNTDWTHLEDLGAARWAREADLSPDDLVAWDREVATLDLPDAAIVRTHGQTRGLLREWIHVKAKLSLLRLSLSDDRLGQHLRYWLLPGGFVPHTDK